MRAALDRWGAVPLALVRDAVREKRYACLCVYAAVSAKQGQDPEAAVSRGEMIRDTGLGEQAVMDAIRWLKKTGWLLRIEKGSAGKKSSWAVRMKLLEGTLSDVSDTSPVQPGTPDQTLPGSAGDPLPGSAGEPSPVQPGTRGVRTPSLPLSIPVRRRFPTLSSLLQELSRNWTPSRIEQIRDASITRPSSKDLLFDTALLDTVSVALLRNTVANLELLAGVSWETKSK